MKKQEVLELLQENAREKAELEKLLQGYNEKRLAEYACIGRLINFKVQKIIASDTSENIENELLALHANLLSQMEYHRENQITTLAELYASALDALTQIRDIIANYLP